MLRHAVVLASSALLVSACVIDRSALEARGEDAWELAPDAHVPPGIDAYAPPGTDAYAPPPDAYAPPGIDAWAADAHTPPPDAYAPPVVDAYTPPPLDAYVPRPDAYTPRPDAWSAPDSGCNGPDDDGDGLRDPCDPWPCGATMPTLAGRVAAESIAISGVQVDGGSAVQVVRAGSSPAVTFDFEIDDEGCSGCIDQIEIGTAPGGRLECVYDANPPGSGARGSASVSLPALTAATPRRVDVRFNLGQDYACDRHTRWWAGEPPGAQTFAVLCVVP